MTKKSEAVIYQAKNGAIELRADVDRETLWATQRQLAEVFWVDVRTINEHIQNVFKEKELAKVWTIWKFRIVQTEEGRVPYLDTFDEFIERSFIKWLKYIHKHRIPNEHPMSEIKYALIPFRDQEILSITKDEKRYVVPKQICENLWLDWEGQRQKIQRDSVLSEGACVIQVPTAGGHQDAVCLPLEYLNGWLFGIDDSRVKETIREAVIAYKKECYVVLYEYFQKGASIDIDRLEGDVELQDFLYRKIRQARTSERSLWERVKQAFADGSTDYDANSELAKKFYALAQDKIHFAVTYKIAAELVCERIEDDAEANFWMKAFDKNRPINVHDLQTGKNYLFEKELQQYENVGEQLLLRIELRILRWGRITMEEWFFEINRLLQENGYQILFDYSVAKHDRREANEKAKQIFTKNKHLLKKERTEKLLWTPDKREEDIPHWEG